MTNSPMNWVSRKIERRISVIDSLCFIVGIRGVGI